MAIYKTKSFARFARKESLNDESLAEAVKRAKRGLVDADLGGGLIKQRIARRGQGRRGGYRVLFAFRSSDLVVFLFGFAKSVQANIDDEQLTILRRIAAAWLSADAETIERFIGEGELVEVEK